MIFWSGHFVILISLALMSRGNYLNWSAAIIILVVFPLIELMTRRFKYIPKFDDRIEKAGELSLFLMPVTLTLVLIFGFKKAGESNSFVDIAALGISCGVLLGAFGITSAHELVHRRSKFYRGLGVYLLMLVNFAHWGLEHVYGHHKNVATPLDPASARRGEMIYSFWFREYFGSLRSAFKINSVKFMIYWSLSLVLGLVVFKYLGMNAFYFWLTASVTAVLLLQTVDYIEHYGLQRKQVAPDRFEPFTFRHAWDTDSWLTNMLLFNLGLHTHHHEKASIAFARLNANPAAPRMPVGYSFTVVMALFPFLYLPIMNRRLDQLK